MIRIALKYSFLAAAIFWIASNTIISAQAYIAQTKKKIDRILDDDFFNSTLIAVDAYNLTTKTKVYQKNERYLLHPASTAKLITSIAGFHYLGKDYRFTTSLFHTGEIRDSVCYGDVYVIGGFDPDLVTEHLDSLSLLIREYGINSFTGNLYADVSMMDSIYWGEGWMWDDNPSLDAPHLSPLVVNDAGIKVKYDPNGYGNPLKVSLIPHTKYFSIINNSIVGDSSNLTISRAWMSNSNNIIIEGTFPSYGTGDIEKLNVYNPSKYFLFLFSEALERNKIRFGGYTDTLTLPLEAKYIGSISHSLSQVAEDLNKRSKNLSAELLLRAIAYSLYGKPASAKSGIKAIDKMLSEIGFTNNDFLLVDGSGLSHYNLVSARLLTEILTDLYINKKDIFEELYKTLPIAGLDGTLEFRMKNGNAFNNVRAKTGTLRGVSCLAGYLTAKNGHKIAFSILMQNHIESTRLSRNYQDQICEILSSME